MSPSRNTDEKIPAIKLTAIQYIIALILVVLLSGLWRLQVLGAQNYRALAQANRVRKVPILAPRGKIFDRDGRLIVDNYPSVTCFLVPEQAHDLNADLPLIAKGLHMDVDQLQSTLNHFRHQPKYQPIPLKQDITPDELAFIAAHNNELPELEIIEEQRRLYPSNGFASHLIGYVGEVSEEMLDDPRYAFYQPGDVVGRSGLEESYDPILRGQDGSRDVIVDSHGRELGILGTEPPVPGKSLKLTIDLDIQEAAEKALGPRSGAIIALDPRTGEVLAMVSHPTFDPNDFAIRIHRDEWNKLLNDPEHPLLNKAIQAQLAPGSTFKIIMALAGLEENVAQTLKVDCHGGATFYGRYFACWISEHHGAHGIVDILHAIPWSCDVYFYTLAQKLGIDTIAKWAHAVGIGQKTGIDLPDEATGVMPSTEWKMRNYHQKWFAGETISVGIGQGAVAVTPIQLIRAIAGIASGGIFKRPHVVFPSEIPPEYREYYQEQFPGSGNKVVPMDANTWQTITDGMAMATLPGGTAQASHLIGIDFAGKTGTAQLVSHSVMKTATGNMRANAWFVGVTPRRNPEIAVVVLWQNGGEGPLSARLGAQVIEAYVDKQRRIANNLHPKPETKLAAAPASANTTAALAKTGQPIEMAGVWNAAVGSPILYPGAKEIPYGPGTVLRVARFALPVSQTPRASKTLHPMR
ncbi:MAG TPA: penicillin-binding protein 2 [Acidobacteriaceae bacterium]|jgi:penicillin-binding protein 2|nr:penicillin-binding protein 2 [Acidobacteriaceae bacterium]